MGGKSSKVTDNYVLRVADGPNILNAPVASPIKEAPSPPNARLARRGSLKGDALQIGNLGGNVNQNHGDAQALNSSPFAKSEKFANLQGLDKLDKLSSPGAASSAKLVRRHSLSNLQTPGAMAAAKSIGSMGKTGAGKNRPNSICSSKCPWIMKSASINASMIDNFEIGRIIGTGLMGTVRIVKAKSGNAHFALKIIKKDYITRHRDQRHINNENAVLSMVTSSFCIKLFGTFQDNNNVYFAMELAAGGELFRRLSKKEAFKPPTAKFYATEIFSALEHVQSLGYVYRDLKPENVMLDEEGHCKLVDFGFAVQPDVAGLIHTICGTPAYLSPEQLNGKFTNGYSKIVDWWSFGVFLYELLTGKTPFCKNNRESSYEIYLRILKTKISFPRSFDSQSKDLITRLCHADVAQRLSDPNLIKTHEYFEMKWEDVKNRRLVPPFVPRLGTEIDDHYFGDYGKEEATMCDSRWDFDGF